MIATDHYAEATGAIINFLGDWQIEAVPATGVVSNPQTAAFIVANSADLGVHKADPRFWQILKTSLRLDAVRRILIIDDFGDNEQAADDYSRRHRVETRMKETVRTLETVFSAAVEIVPVMIGADAKNRDARIETLIADATAAIGRHLV
jgi:predicted class III extradiol MEMO1 family dioxygenase